TSFSYIDGRLFNQGDFHTRVSFFAFIIETLSRFSCAASVAKDRIATVENLREERINRWRTAAAGRPIL
ncbi:hypothetical protein ABLN64_03890, partial [Mycobacterium tuberculosis]